jgi:DNA polymerase I-like protein with 3'-5' exonuclease and polymerase domains
MKIVVFDFETYDPYLSKGANGRKMGPGWVFKYNEYVGCDFEVLGMSYDDGEKSEYITDFSLIPSIFKDADLIVAHNAAYDLGCLLALGYEDLVDSFYGRTICTVIACKLLDSSCMSYSLDNQAKKYCKASKEAGSMYKDVWDSEIYPLLKKEQKEKDKCVKDGVVWNRGEMTPAKMAKVKKWTYGNLNIVQDKKYSIVAEYAISDAVVTRELFLNVMKLSKKFYSEPINVCAYWCRLLHVCQSYTKKGVRVNMETVDNARQWLQPRINELLKEIYNIVGYEFNIMSSPQLAGVFTEMSLHVGKTPGGNPSVTKEILEAENHPIAQKIRNVKQYINIRDNFIGNIPKIQEYTMKEGDSPMRKYGRIHTHFTPMGAVTGRFSCSNLNLQQIPKRNRELGQWCRGIFEPENGQTWYSLDFSNQEGRLQIHYAAKLKVDGYEDLVEKFDNDPGYDLHQEVADMILPGAINESEKEMKGRRKNAKAINLGLSYGMGSGKMCTDLGLPTKKYFNKYKQAMMDCAGEEGKALIDSYHELFPFLKQLIEKTIASAKSNNFIRTLGGRASSSNAMTHHKAFNKLIQGSAFDQTAISMIKAYELKIPVSITIHDELCISGTEEDALKLKDVMENTVSLAIPSMTDVESGDNWWTACGG